MAIRVLLVDDHQMVLEGLKGLLASDPEIQIIGEALNGEQAIELIGKLTPDAIVLDVTMPGLNGIETMRQIRKLSPESEVIGLSMHAAGQVVCMRSPVAAGSARMRSNSVDPLL